MVCFTLIGWQWLVVGFNSDECGLRGVGCWCLVCLRSCLGFVCLMLFVAVVVCLMLVVVCGLCLVDVCGCEVRFGWLRLGCLGLWVGSWCLCCCLLGVAVFCIAVAYGVGVLGCHSLFDLVLWFITCVDVVCFWLGACVWLIVVFYVFCGVAACLFG